MSKPAEARETMQTSTGRVLVLPTPEENAAIMAAALSDPDAQPLTESDFKQMPPVRGRMGRPKADVTKVCLTIRIDPDVLARWRASGKGWQTRAAAVLAMAAP
jgi:uncharacterized protein (DUF4415 family)